MGALQFSRAALVLALLLAVDADGTFWTPVARDAVVVPDAQSATCDPYLAACKNFRLFRQHILQQRERQAAEDASGRLQLLEQGLDAGVWSHLDNGIVQQPLDHFSWQDRRTFNQRFWANRLFWHPHGPIFLYIEGEGTLSIYSVLSGHHVEMARKYGALVVALEHRFYGASLNPDGLEDHNLQYLTSQQALADLLSFHRFITQKYGLLPSHTWICVGGSYAGSLAAWLRLKYPHLVFAAVASSAPVRAQLDFAGYNKVVAAGLSSPMIGGSQECLGAVAEAFSAVDSLLHAGQLARLAKDFRSCEPLRGTDDATELLSNLADIFMGAVQYNAESPLWTVAHACGRMTDRSKGSPYQRLMAANDMYLAMLHVQCAQNSYAAEVEELRSTRAAGSRMGRQWFFQTCTEFGYYPTCDDPACPFSRLPNLTSSLIKCLQVFNISPRSVREAVAFTNDFYGADQPRATRVLFVNGDIDPWHVLSVLQNQTRSERAILINGTAHCADMLASAPSDPLPLVQAREQIVAQVAEWLELARKMQQET